MIIQNLDDMTKNIARIIIEYVEERELVALVMLYYKERVRI